MLAGVDDSPDQILSIFSIEEDRSELPPSILISSKFSENKSTTIGPGVASPVLIFWDDVTVFDVVPDGERIVFETLLSIPLAMLTV